MFAVAALISLAVAFVLDVVDKPVDFPFALLGVMLLAAHFAFGPWTPWGPRAQ